LNLIPVSRLISTCLAVMPAPLLAGWMFNFSGVMMNLDPYQPNGQRTSSIQFNDQPLNQRAHLSIRVPTEAGRRNTLGVSPSLRSDQSVTIQNIGEGVRL
jgi:hypothetical protein